MIEWYSVVVIFGLIVFVASMGWVLALLINKWRNR